MRLVKSHRIFFLALILAVFLWLYVRLGSKFQMTVDVPLQIINVKEGHGLVSDVPEKVTLLLEGDGKTLLGLRYLNPPKFVIDLALHPKSRFVLSQWTSEIVFPAKQKATVVAVQQPDSIDVIIELLASKKVPIQADVQAVCSPGFILVGGVRTEPDSILITVPRSRLDSVHEITTKRVAFNGLEADRRFKVSLVASKGSWLRYSETEIWANLDVQALGEIVIENIPVRLTNVPPFVNIAVQPSTFSIKVRGGVDYLATLPKDSIVGTIDYAKEYNAVQPRLDITVPRDLSWTQVTPARFNLAQFPNDSLAR